VKQRLSDCPAVHIDGGRALWGDFLAMAFNHDDDPIQHLPDDATLSRMAMMVRDSERVVFFTGAGISTESGLPDYRGPEGVWSTGKIPHADDMNYGDEDRVRFWQDRRERFPFMQSRRPNSGHIAIARLERADRVLAIITQNIDSLHQKAGNHPERVIELHGSSYTLRCLNCGHVMDGEVIQQKLEAGDPDPRCEICGGPLRSGTILFGEALPRQALELAHKVSLVTDLMIVVGSSLVVNPAARLPAIAKERGAGLIIVNRTPTPIDNLADIVVRTESGPTLSALADLVLDGRVHTYIEEDSSRDHDV
jgi:NAD-dependent deacetylase